MRVVPLFLTISPAEESVMFAFKNGCIQGAYITMPSTLQITNYFIVSTTFNIVKTNKEGVEVQDTFYIAGTSSKESSIDVDSSYIVITEPILFISPFVNALFTLAVKSDDNTLVLVNCLDINTSFLRKLYGISEYAVIPAPKEGEYIEASLFDTADTMELSSKEPNSFLLGKLKSSLESLIENIEVNTETKAVVD